MDETKLGLAFEAAAELVVPIEPARGKVEVAALAAAAVALDNLAAAQAADPVDDDRERQIAALYARAAAVAIAAGDDARAERWLVEAERLAHDKDREAERAAGRRSLERYRALVHGRFLITNDREREARAIWRALSRRDGERDELARAAASELEAPRPIGPGDTVPTLGRYNGFGTGFYGRRATWQDRSYATTYCISALWIPVFPLSAWRVRDQQGGYSVLAREQLSRFARTVRWALPAAIVLVIASVATSAYLQDPERLARQRWDAVLAQAHRADAEPALQLLDAELARDLDLVDAERAERAGVEVVRLATSRVARPLTLAALDQTTRVVRRFQTLPPRAREGAARAAMLDALDGWTAQLGSAADSAEARLGLLRAAHDLASADRRAKLAAQLAATRLAIATTRQADWPLEALSILVERTAGSDDRPAILAADRLVEQLAASPSLLVDAGGDLDRWLQATGDATARDRISHLRQLAVAGRAEAEAEGVTAKQLAALAAQRPSDQYVALQLARGDASAGRLDAADARLTKLGAPGWTIRDARMLRAQIASAQGKLELADGLLASLLGARLTRFAEASAAVNEAGTQADARISGQLKAGNVPDDFRRRYEATTDEAQHRALVQAWYREQLDADPALKAARDRYTTFTDVVPAALAAGSVKLRRAQGAVGGARTALLEDAERMFLAIRNEAEGQPTFRLALGEVYARLGKTAESDAELGKVLAGDDRMQHLGVAAVYRALGSTARAKQIAEQVFGAADAQIKSTAASLLGTMERDLGHDDEAEAWYRKAGSALPAVAVALLELEAARLERAGKPAECADKLVQAAKLHLASRSLNNAGLAYVRSFNCSSDPKVLRDAEAALEAGYQGAPDDAIVVSNLADILQSNGELRVLARHVNTHALRLQVNDAAQVIDKLVDGSERDSLIAELAADPGMRRAADLLAQAAILAPNNASLYVRSLEVALRQRDPAAVAAIVERARRATGIDSAGYAAERKRARSGAGDAQAIADLEAARVRLAASTSGLDPHSRATGAFVLARTLSHLAVLKADPALAASARDAALTAARLWPALDTSGMIASTLIDEAGFTVDPTAWRAARRERSAYGAITKLAADRAPIAAAIRATRPWADVAAYVRADQSRPGVDELRLARLLGDPVLEAHARAVLDDPLAPLAYELALQIDPGDDNVKADLAYLKAR